MDKPENSGITVLIDILNSTDFNILFDFNDPDDATCKAFALFLSLLERGNIYTFFLDKIKKIVQDKESKDTEVLEKVFSYKKTIDASLDLPAVLPRDVFKR